MRKLLGILFVISMVIAAIVAVVTVIDMIRKSELRYKAVASIVTALKAVIWLIMQPAMWVGSLIVGLANLFKASKR